MEVKVMGLDSNKPIKGIDADELEQLITEVELLKYIKKDYAKLIASNLKVNYSQLWKRLTAMKEQSSYAKMRYYQLLPYFETGNLEAMISKEFDNQILKNGWIPSQLNVVSGLSGGGKTSLAIMISAVLISGINPLFPEKGRQKQAKVLYVNLEQANEELEKRMIALFSVLNDVKRGIAYSSLMNAKNLNDKDSLQNLKIGSYLYSKFCKNFDILNNYDFDTNDIDDIYEKIKQIHSKNHYEIIIIDQYSNIKESDEVSERIATTLRDMARELNVPVVVLAQMNKISQRESMNEDGIIDVNKISGIALKGASALEQQASNVTFIIPSGKQKKQYGKEGKVVTIVNKKGRYGTGNQISMLFLSEFNLFVDIKEIDTINNDNATQEVYIDETV